MQIANASVWLGANEGFERLATVTAFHGPLARHGGARRLQVLGNQRVSGIYGITGPNSG